MKSFGMSNAKACPALKDTVDAVSSLKFEGRIPSKIYMRSLSGDQKLFALFQMKEVGA